MRVFVSTVSEIKVYIYRPIYPKSNLSQRFGETYHTRALYIAACQSELNVVLQYLFGNLIILVALTMF